MGPKRQNAYRQTTIVSLQLERKDAAEDPAAEAAVGDVDDHETECFAVSEMSECGKEKERLEERIRLEAFASELGPLIDAMLELGDVRDHVYPWVGESFVRASAFGVHGPDFDGSPSVTSGHSTRPGRLSYASLLLLSHSAFRSLTTLMGLLLVFVWLLAGSAGAQDLSSRANVPDSSEGWVSLGPPPARLRPVAGLVATCCRWKTAQSRRRARISSPFMAWRRTTSIWRRRTAIW